MVALLEISKFAEFIIGNKCDAINVLLVRSSLSSSASVRSSRLSSLTTMRQHKYLVRLRDSASLARRHAAAAAAATATAAADRRRHLAATIDASA